MEPILKVPEFIIHTAIENSLKFIREDYKAHAADPDKSYLRKLTKLLSFERYNYTQQAEQVFLADNEDPRFLSVDLMFNMVKDSPPAIHITMPSETPSNNSLGLDEGSRDAYINYEMRPDPDSPEEEIETATSLQEVFTRQYKATYDIVIVSDNSNEVVMIYHILRALLVALIPHFTLSGLHDITLPGQDLQPYADLLPKTMFMRAIRMNLEYESSTLNFVEHPLINNLVFENKVVNE